ncbi:MAG TPA: VPDSG-CTERM sorting domain-containing protein, partial [Pyrinomonadaceae bacterium]
YWAFPVVSLGPAVISSHRFQTGDYYENAYLGSDSLLSVASIFNVGGSTSFFNRSTAGSAFIENDVGSTNFFERSTAGTSSISNNDGTVNFFDNSSAGSAGFSSFLGGGIAFFDNSTAGNATMGLLSFEGEAFVRFADSSNAGSATITLRFGTDIAAVSFEDSSRGGTARIRFDGFPGDRAILDISAHDAPGVTIGSIEGEGGDGFLGANNLTVGSNNLSTTFPGVIQDGAPFGGGGTGGSLTKIGTGTFILTGANTYTGDTNVNRGVLQVDGSITSNTFVNQSGRLAGTGTVNGNLTNNGRVSPGSAGSPGMLTVTGNYTQAQYATLMIQLAGANAGEFSVLNILGTANLSGQLKPVLLNGFLPTVGESFTFLQYGAVNGTLFMFNRNIDNLPEHWEVSYFPTFAVLTVAAGNVPVPDQASTLLLLMLGLSALLMCRQHLVCKTDVN